MKRTENIVYAIAWGVIFMIPLTHLFVEDYHLAGYDSPWGAVARSWSFIVPLLVLFLVHNGLVAPMLTYRHKKKEYFILASLLMVVLGIYVFLPKGMNPPVSQVDSGITSPEAIVQTGDGPIKYVPMRPLAPEMVRIILALLVIGANLSIKYFFKSIQDDRDMEDLKKENLESQLQYLKYQISPHFFMNTLNNIHALVDIDPDKAKDSIVRLSKLMRYMLYEGEKTTITMDKEISFLEQYISLMKLRYSDSVKISLSVPDKVGGIEIPPLLFISFVENAFKHGISYKKDSFVDVALSRNEDKVVFNCRNSMNASTSGSSEGGIGIDNTIHRLDLLYGDEYSLDISDSGGVFNVCLEIPSNFNLKPILS